MLLAVRSITISGVVAVGSTERLAAAKFLIHRPTFFVHLGHVHLIHLNDLAPQKESHLGFESVAAIVSGSRIRDSSSRRALHK